MHRLLDSECRMITSGSVFMFDENKSGMKPWMRVLGNFLVSGSDDVHHLNEGADS